MKITNTSEETQTILTNDAGSMTIAAGDSAEVSALVGADLLTSFPTRWKSAEPAEKKPPKGVGK